MCPISASHSKAVYDALKACGVRIVSALPETWLVHLSIRKPVVRTTPLSGPQAARRMPD